MNHDHTMKTPFCLKVLALSAFGLLAFEHQ